MRGIKYLGIFILFSATYAHAQYFKTLPQGVRMFVYRFVEVPEVGSSYNRSKSETPYNYSFNADATALRDWDNPDIQAIFSAFPQLENLSLGTYHLEAKGNVQVDGYGFAYGITNKLTAYTSLPVYKANVKLNYKRAKGNNFDEVAGNMQSNGGGSMNQGIGEAIEKALPDINGPQIQSILTETFGYKPLGTWDGQGLGDMELGLLYNLREEKNWGLAGSAGVVLPTGRVDDPDMLQDFGFGDGQFDFFGEFGGGYSPMKSLWVNTYLRYTYQLESEKNLRVPYNSEITISDKKGNFTEKLGNKWNYGLTADYTINDWISVTGSYLFEHIGEAEYWSKYGEANDFLAQDTESSSHSLRGDLVVSSITPFLKKKFVLPGQLTLSYQTMVAGKNTNKIDRVELEFRMLF